VVLRSPLPHKCRHMSFLVVLLSSCTFCGSRVATLFLATRLPQKMIFWRHVCGRWCKRKFEAPIKTRAIKKLLVLLSLIKFKLPHICRQPLLKFKSWIKVELNNKRSERPMSDTKNNLKAQIKPRQYKEVQCPNCKTNWSTNQFRRHERSCLEN
jgi:hypothetical protein